MSTCASCGGTIEDGYCTTCGLAAVPSAPGPVSATTPGATSRPGAAPGPAAASGPGSAPSPGSASSPGSATSARGSTGTRGSRSSGRSGSRRSSGRSVRGHLGAGLVDIPPVPYRDPSIAVLSDPQVPENRRFCGNCGKPVGRSRDGRPGLADGFCRNCGSRFSFTPKLKPGDLVAGQYDVLGCLAFGGLGWIYLARDRNVSDRWVVLKGLLNTGDPDALEAAMAERQFLAQVEHPNIVRIYNFVHHADAGYIVMEYVGGKSLKDIRRAGPVPLAHAIAYAIEVLPALGYLHDRGLVYCDFKPDNVIQTEEQLKLIDMGGVRAIEGDGAIYGTVGYQAPEIATDGPSVSSDLFTVARALAVMTFDFKGYQSQYTFTFPADVPLLAEQESFARLLRRATDPDPGRRFGSAGEMAEQLTGVLREVLAVADSSPRPAFSTLFTPERQSIVSSQAAPTAVQVNLGLPVPQVDRADPAAGYLATLAALDPVQRGHALRSAIDGGTAVPPDVASSPEMKFALARARLDAGHPADMGEVLAELAADDPSDWRIAWYDGMRRLADGDVAAARGAFDAVYGELPGELAPKLALALAVEAAGDTATSTRYFRLVWTVDQAYVSAAFGLARSCLAASDRPGAIAALSEVPATSSHYDAAQIAAIRIGVMPGFTEQDIRQAAGRLGRLSELDEARRQELTAAILTAALDLVTTRPHGAGGELLGCEMRERPLRFGLERAYRALARLAPERSGRIELIDRANAVRPRTWI
jgi:serine/threonine-protein kinase PknG